MPTHSDVATRGTTISPDDGNAACPRRASLRTILSSELPAGRLRCRAPTSMRWRWLAMQPLAVNHDADLPHLASLLPPAYSQ